MTTTDTVDLERRLRRLEDERDLADLVSRYAFYADSGQHEAWLDLFTDDGVIELVGMEATGTYAAHTLWSGRSELASFISDPNVHMAIEGRCMHLTTGNIRTHVNVDDAVVDAYYTVLLREGTSILVANAGFTRLHCRRADGRWWIMRRTRHAVGTSTDVLRSAYPVPAPST